MKLATQPSDNVTVTVARTTTGSPDTDLSVKTGASLTFTKTNWSTDQTVTLQAAEDDDHADGSAKFKHSASGGGYDGVSAELTATENDNDTAAITLSTATLTVTEGGTATYTVQLATEPSDDVTIAVARKTGNDHDTDLSVKTGASLTFTTTNWSTAQTVTLQAAEDADAINGTATFTHTASDGGYDDVDAELIATESDNDTPGITLSASTLTVSEGNEASYQVKLATRPAANVTVTVRRKSGSDQDTHLSVKSGASLTFTTTNWDTDQTVTLQAAEDDDHANGSAKFEHTANGGGYNNVKAELTATESDNDTAALTLSANARTVPEGGQATYRVKLATQPSGNVTVTVARKTTGTQDPHLSVKSGASLTFTKSNWNANQTVTLKAAEDPDDKHGTADFTHTASGADYGNVTAELTATESDNDSPGLKLSTTTLSVPEDGEASYRVQLATLPDGDVTVAVARKTGADQDTDLSVKSGASLTFTTGDWNVDQTVTIEAGEDDDHVNGTAVFVHDASGTRYNNVSAELTATERDDDRAGLVLSASTLALAEGGEATYEVRLNTKPAADVTVTIASDAPDALTVSPASLSFTTSTWDTDQTVTATALDDADGDSEARRRHPHAVRRRLRHRATGDVVRSDQRR